MWKVGDRKRGRRRERTEGKGVGCRVKTDKGSDGMRFVCDEINENKGPFWS